MQQGEFKTLKYLWDQSSSPYTKLLASPGGSQLTGWKKVRPSAEYNLTSRRSGPRKKPQNREYKSHKRTPLFASSYMSGELDEDYSYVYDGGLSKRCRSAISRSRVTLPPSIPQWNVPKLSTVYLNPTVPQPPNMAQLQSELVAMQTKPELMAEQIIIKNRLRNMGCLSTPSLDLESVRYDSKSIHHRVDRDKVTSGMCLKSAAAAVQSKCAPSLTVPQHATKVKGKKLKSQLLEWWKSSTDITSPGDCQHKARKEFIGMSNLFSVKTNTSLSEATVIPSNCAPCNSSGGETSFSSSNFVPCTAETRNQIGKSKAEIETAGVAGWRFAGGVGIRSQDHITLPAVFPLREQHDCGGGAGLLQGKHAHLWHQLNRTQEHQILNLRH